MESNRGITHLGYYPKNVDSSSFVWFLDSNPIYFLNESVHPPEFVKDLVRLDSDIVEFEDKNYEFDNMTAIYDDSFVEMTYNDSVVRYLKGNNNYVLRYRAKKSDNILSKDSSYDSSLNDLSNWSSKIIFPLDFNIYFYDYEDSVDGVLEPKHNMGDRIVPAYRFGLTFQGEYFTFILARIDNTYYQVITSMEGDSQLYCSPIRKVEGRIGYDPYLILFSKNKYFGELSLFTKFDYERISKSNFIKIFLP